MKKFILFISLIFISFNTFALTEDYNVTSSITSPTAGNLGAGYYTGTEILYEGGEKAFSVNTRYNGVLSGIRFNLPLPSNWSDGSCFSTGDLNYRLTLNMATSDWRNKFAYPFISSSSSGTNWATSNVVFVSMKEVYFDFKIPNNNSCQQYLYVRLNSSRYNLDEPFTGVSNWNLSKIILSVTYPGGSSSSGGSSGATNNDIINNNNDNTNTIVENNNSNTNTIVENNNSNTDRVIESQKELLSTCSKNYLSFDDVVTLYDRPYNYRIYLEPGKSYNLSSNAGIGACIHNGNLNCVHEYLFDGYAGLSLPDNYTFTANSNTLYVSFTSGNGWGYYDMSYNENMLSLGSSKVPFVPYGDTKCVSKIDSTNDKLDDINDTINNSNIDNDLGNGFFNDFESNDFGFSDIIKIPLTYINQLTSSSCVALSIPIPFTNNSITLPCMTSIYQTYIPTIFNIWQVVSFGVISYFIVLDLFRIVKGFKDPDSDKVEVLDL